MKHSLLLLALVGGLCAQTCVMASGNNPDAPSSRRTTKDTKKKKSSWKRWAKRGAVGAGVLALLYWFLRRNGGERGQRVVPPRPRIVLAPNRPVTLAQARARAVPAPILSQGFYVAQRDFYTTDQVNSLAEKGRSCRVLFGENTNDRYRRTTARIGALGGQTRMFPGLTEEGLACMQPVTTTDYTSESWKASRKRGLSVGYDKVVEALFNEDVDTIDMAATFGTIIVVPIGKSDGSCTIGQGVANISDSLKGRVRKRMDGLLEQGPTCWLERGEVLVPDATAHPD